MNNYGFILQNNNNKVVLTDEHIIYQLFEESILNGVYNTTWNCYHYVTDASSIEFFNLEIGDWVGRAHNNELISNRSSITVRKLKTADTIFRPSGEYGMKLFNASGILTYSSNSPVGGVKESMLVRDFYIYDPKFTSCPSPTHLRSYSWFCITTTIVASADFGSGNGTAVPVVGKYSDTELSFGYFRQYSSTMFAINGITNVNYTSILCT